MGFSVCFVKGIVADTLAQKVIGRRQDPPDLRRTLAMALFSGTFCGCVYHSIFNVLFMRVWGTSSSLLTIASKAAADGIVVFPFMYMPTYIFFDEFLCYGSVSRIFTRWCDEIGASMRKYVYIWPATMVCVFTVVPIELRISFISGVSFMWLILLSVISHEELVDPPVEARTSSQNGK
jgi:hypothetical protein